jgi:EAL domain-containing protein (putative c-di-GMP-specific phosphodiesterase class I)
VPPAEFIPIAEENRLIGETDPEHGAAIAPLTRA